MLLIESDEEPDNLRNEIREQLNDSNNRFTLTCILAEFVW